MSAHTPEDNLSVMLDDLDHLIEALGKPLIARPDTPHFVMEECIADVKRLRLVCLELLEVLSAVSPLIDAIDAMLEGWDGPTSKSPLGPLVHAAIAKAEGL